MHCLTLNPSHLEKINELNYTPVGLGSSTFSSSWIRDNTKINIANKNKFFGEYTFHYWMWKNYISELEDSWIGFCQYRKFWSLNHINSKEINFNQLKDSVLSYMPANLEEYESIIGEPFYVNKCRFSKNIKKNFKTMIMNPSLFYDSNLRTIKFHFDMWHGKGNLDKAINILDKKDRSDFKEYVNTSVSFHPHNMFICKNKQVLLKYYESIFPWLENCEKLFGFKGLDGYGKQRIYGFLAERYMSFWFRKYTKFKTLPIVFKDITDFL